MIEEELEQLVKSYEVNAIISSGENAKDIFCEGWPLAKKVLESVAKMMPKLTFIIQLIIVAGDAFAERNCP